MRAERLPLLIALGGLLAWELGVRAGLISALFCPAPSTIARNIVDLARSGELGANLGATLARLAWGLTLGSAAGLALGLAMGWSRSLRVTLDPFVAALHAVPKLAMFPLLLIFFGIGELPKVLIAVLGSFFPVLISTMAGVRELSPVFFEVAHNLGASRRLTFTRILLPASLPPFLGGVRLAFNTSLVMIIGAEMVSIESGLGRVIWHAWQTMRVEELYASLAVTVALGLGCNALLELLARRLMPWRPGHGR